MTSLPTLLSLAALMAQQQPTPLQVQAALPAFAVGLSIIFVGLLVFGIARHMSRRRR